MAGYSVRFRLLDNVQKLLGTFTKRKDFPLVTQPINQRKLHILNDFPNSRIANLKEKKLLTQIHITDTFITISQITLHIILHSHRIFLIRTPSLAYHQLQRKRVFVVFSNFKLQFRLAYASFQLRHH